MTTIEGERVTYTRNKKECTIQDDNSVIGNNNNNNTATTATKITTIELESVTYTREKKNSQYNTLSLITRITRI